MHELVGALLPFSGKVAIGEMVAVEALMGSTVGAIKDDEGGTREASDVYFTGSEACRRASGDIAGVFDMEKVCIQLMLVFVANLWLKILPWCGRHIRRRRYHSGSRRLS